jgi:tetratricopeptide (TPR) repeat protein
MTKGAGKRTFPRNKLNLDFDLILKGEYVPAVITDFSLYGMGILVKGKSDLNTQILDLKIHTIDVNAIGKIVWKQEMFAGLKVGVQCVGPVEGRLRSYCFADLVVGIYRSSKTGVLMIETGQWSRKIFFKDGEMVYATSDIEEEQLGSMLLSSGRISLHQYQSSLARARETGKSQGTLLVEMRYLTPPELVAAVHQRVETVIMNLSGVEDAKFSFREEALPRGEIVMMKLNSAELLYRGSKRIVRPNMVRNTYLTPGALLNPSVEKMSVLHRLSLDEHDRQILSLVQENTTLGEVLSRSPLKQEETIRTMFALINARVIDITEEMQHRGDAVDMKEEAAAPVSGQPTEQEVIDKIERLYEGHRKLSYHGVLGLQQQSVTPAELKRAYHAMAKEYHPDRYLHITSPAVREKLNSLFVSINEAYRELSKYSGTNRVGPDPQIRPQESPEDKSRNLAETKYREGKEHLAAGDLDEAMTLLGQAVYLCESEPDYHFFYGVALYRKKKIKEAEASIRKALHLSPHRAEYIAELGYIYLKLGFRARARNAFEKALKLDPSNSRASDGLRRTEEMQS